MAKRSIPKVNVDAEHFKGYLDYRGVTIAELARSVDVNPRYLYQALDEGSISLLTALDVCKFLDCKIVMAFGPQDHMTIGRFARDIYERL